MALVLFSHGSNQTAHLMLVALCRLIIRDDSVLDSIAFKGVNQLLTIVDKQDLYELANEQSGVSPLQFYRHLVNTLLIYGKENR